MMERAWGRLRDWASREADRRWLAWVLVAWIVAAVVLVAWKWLQIRWFVLPDTDDNLRIVQVRDWLGGQGWFDLRQYRLDPPEGADIHWSRLVDLPIAGLILLLRLFATGADAERWAVAIAPMLPLALMLVAVSLSARRLVAPGAFAIAGLALLCAQAPINMVSPERIDHHGWQLAFLALMAAGCVDPRARRGGVTAGAAAALSLSVGLEMLPYLGLAAGSLGLRWILDRGEAERLRGFGVAVAAGSALGFLLFASDANRLPVCDALSPVWLSAALAGGAAFVWLAGVTAERPAARLWRAGLAAAIVVAGFALAWPHCLGAPERLSPELRHLWFDNIREVKPIVRHGWRTAAPVLTLPILGAIGAGWMLWRERRTSRAGAWGTTLLLGAASLAWILIGRAMRRPVALAVPLAASILLVTLGLVTRLTVWAVPPSVSTKPLSVERRAARRCPTLSALRPIARLPVATIMTHVDLSPRLIAVTHHRAIAGPYHRNQQALLDVHHLFRGSADQARAIMRRHGATLLLICPGTPESTIYLAQSRRGFYAQLRRGRVPGWLAPVALPAGSPFRLWRVAEEGVNGGAVRAISRP